MRRILYFPIVGCLLLPVAQMACGEGAIRFEKYQLDHRFRAEGVAVGDFNRDGRRDIAAGSVWYAAPDWQMHTILEEPQEYEPKNYSGCFNAWVEDLNGDGWDDIIQVVWPGKEAVWFENPKGAATPWRRHVLLPVASNESPQYVDIDGDGQKELVCAFATADPDGPHRWMGIARRGRDPYEPWTMQPISAAAAPGTQRYAHGLGVGDVNGDGRLDVLVTAGWWEAPEDRRQTDWQFHPAPFGEYAADIRVFDFDGDGDNDVLTSSPHNYGIWWHEQLAEGQWRTHEIDNRFSQTHALWLADIDGDGLPDFVTGKRWWAHGGNDPGGDEPAVLYWYRLTRRGGQPTWTPHQIDMNSGHGTQFEVVDVDGDGLLDIVTANKKGVFYFRQVRE